MRLFEDVRAGPCEREEGKVPFLRGEDGPHRVPVGVGVLYVRGAVRMEKRGGQEEAKLLTMCVYESRTSSKPSASPRDVGLRAGGVRVGEAERAAASARPEGASQRSLGRPAWEGEARLRSLT